MKQYTLSIIACTLLFAQLHGFEKIENVIITSKSSGDPIDTPGSYTIVSKEDIKEMNANTIAEVLEEKAGITTGINSSSIYGRSTISLRGTDSRQSLILIDGRRVSASDALIGHSDFAYNWVPMNSIEKIEIVKGPMSSLYGSQAIGGVINIITKKPSKELTGEIDLKHGASSAEGGDENSVSFNIAGSITKKLSASFSGQLSDIEPLKNSAGAGARREGRNIRNGVVNVWYDIDDTQQVSISSMRGSEKRDIIDYKEYYDNEKAHDAVEYEKYFGDVKFNAKYYKTSLDSHNEQLEFANKMDDDVFNAELAFGNFENHYIIFGAERRAEKYHKDYDNNPSKDFRNKIDYTSAYFQDEIGIGDDFIFTIGSRYDKHEQFGGEISPKLSAVYKLDTNQRIKGSYGHGFNAPSLTQNSDDYILAVPIKFTPPMEFNRFRGNADLKPEISDSFELGYEYKGVECSLKTAFFYTRVKDLITHQEIGTTMLGPIIYNERKYLNVDKASIYGFELEYEKKKLFSNLDVYAGYSYLDTKNDISGEKLIFRPDHKINLKLVARLPFNIKSTLRANYIGTQYNGEKDLDPYATFGLQFAKDLKKGFTLVAGVDNVTDKQLESEYNFQIKNRVIYTRINYKF